MGGSSSKNKPEKTAKPKERKKTSDTPVSPPTNNNNNNTPVEDPRTVETVVVEKEDDVEFKKRVERFYAYYNPNKMSSVPSILSSWNKRKEELMEELVKRYGPEPLESNDTAALTHGDDEKNPIEGNTSNIKYPEERNSTDMTEIHTTMIMSPNTISSPVPVCETDNNMTHTSMQSVYVHSFRRRLSSFLGVRAPHKLHTLEVCLQKYKESETELFDFLRETYGVDPSEDETITYFVRRLEGLYNCYDPNKVQMAEIQLADHYGEEDEFLQFIANTFGPDPMLESPSHKTISHLFEYNTEELSEEQKEQKEEEKEEEEKDYEAYEVKEKEEFRTEIQHKLPLLSCEVNDESVQDNTPYRQCDDFTSNIEPLTHHIKEEKTTEECEKEEVSPITKMADTVPSDDLFESLNSAKEDAEKYRRIVEDQQKELAELNEEIQRLRNLLKEPSVNVSHHSRHLSTVSGQSHSEPFISTDKSTNKVEHFQQEKKKKEEEKTILLPITHSTQHPFSMPRTQSKNSIDNLLPPPPLSHSLREVSPIKKNSILKDVSLFVSRRFLFSPSVSSAKRVRTLSEMRLEYEREREAIRLAEITLDPYNVTQYGFTSPVGTKV